MKRFKMLESNNLEIKNNNCETSNNKELQSLEPNRQNRSSRRKTLVKDFKEIVERGNEEEIKAVFNRCNVNAYGGYYKSNALSFHLTEQLMKWLVENGANIEYKDSFKNTPLHHQSMNTNGHPEYLIRLGANLEAENYRKETPLFFATEHFCFEHVKTLVEAGANVNAVNEMKETPLLKAMICTRNENIPDLVQIVNYLFEHGAKLTGYEQKQVKRIGTDFEWFQNQIDKGCINEIESNLMELYELFEVEPVPKK